MEDPRFVFKYFSDEINLYQSYILICMYMICEYIRVCITNDAETYFK